MEEKTVVPPIIMKDRTGLTQKEPSIGVPTTITGTIDVLERQRVDAVKIPTSHVADATLHLEVKF